MLGFDGIARSNPDYYKLQVMNYILGGGGFASRLVKEVRSKAGLAYSIASYYQAGAFPRLLPGGAGNQEQERQRGDLDGAAADAPDPGIAGYRRRDGLGQEVFDRQLSA